MNEGVARAARFGDRLRVDQLDGKLDDRHITIWEAVRERIDAGTMPPKNAKPQPTDADRERMTRWIDDALVVARARRVTRNGLIRRLTVAQYRNTLRELLMLPVVGALSYMKESSPVRMLPTLHSGFQDSM